MRFNFVVDEFSDYTRILFLLCCVWSERNNEADVHQMAAQEQKIFAYETLTAATKNFSAIHKLGEGGFGPVYKVNSKLITNFLICFVLGC